MRRHFATAFILALAPQPPLRPSCRRWRRASRRADVRLKDMATLQGFQVTTLLGYGLVVGLNKTGDRRQTIFSPRRSRTCWSASACWSRAKSQNREHRGGDGHRRDAAVPPVRRPARRHGLVGWRRAEPSGRDAAAHAAARYRWRGRRAGAGSAVARRLRRRAGRQSVQVNHLTVGRVPIGRARPGGVAQTAPAERSARSHSSRSRFHSATRMADAINKDLGRARPRRRRGLGERAGAG